MKLAVSLCPCMEKRGQLQAGDPAFGAGFQGEDVFRRQVQPHHLIEELGGFGRGKTQVSRRAARSIGHGRASGPGADVDPHAWQ